jgi:subtilisin family serine protease
MTYVIGVGSINYSDRRSPFSNYDGSATTAAPGEALVTTFPGNNYAGVWGTSFSSALVAGTAAWLHQVQPHSGYGGIMDAINAGPHIDQDMGDARLDVLKALAFWSTKCASGACRDE